MKNTAPNRANPLLKLAAAAGLAMPVLFGAVLGGLTLLQYDFMRSLGWSPLAAPTFDWPSGLALGPWGWLMTATFVLSGLLTGLFGLGLRWALAGLPAGKAAGGLLVLAGLAMVCLASPTDPTLRTTPATLTGNIHDLAYVALGLTLFPAILLCGWAFRRAAFWRSLAGFTWLAAGLSIPAFALKGIAIYLFLVVILSWGVAAAWRLWRAAA